MFNLWRRYSIFKPKKSGKYLCKVVVNTDPFTIRIMDLHFNNRTREWLDYRRQNVFDGYKVYKQCKAPIDDNRVFSDILCDRSLAVFAWKRLK